MYPALEVLGTRLCDGSDAGKIGCKPSDFEVPRYVFVTLTRSRSAARQEPYWYDAIQRRYTCQTVRTECRLPRVRRFADARLTRYIFDDYLLRRSPESNKHSRWP